MMKNTSEFLSYLLKLAEEKRSDAGFAGAMGDYGAGAIENEVAIYQAALIEGVPKCWEDEYIKFTNQLDPEYGEYIRLQKKFNK